MNEKSVIELAPPQSTVLPPALAEKRAIFIWGPESSGCRFVTKVFIAAGCQGDEDHAQRFDSPNDHWDDPNGSFEGAGDLVVWRRSVPHAHGWPPLVQMVRRLRDLGYRPTIVVTMRDEYAMAVSQATIGHTPDLETARRQIREGYIRIWKAIEETGVMDVHQAVYEAYTRRPEVLVELVKACGLTLTDPPTVKDGNAKYFPRTAETPKFPRTPVVITAGPELAPDQPDADRYVPPFAGKLAHPGTGPATTLRVAVASATLSKTPTGMVTFFHDRSQLGIGRLDESGVATLTTSALGLGPNRVTCEYWGDDAFEAQMGPSWSVVTGSAHERFVDRIYQDLLGRRAGTTELSALVSRLDAGLTHEQVAREFVMSPAYLEFVVDGLYLRHMGRHADEAGLASWVQRIQGGCSLETIKTIMLASQEYYAIVGNSDLCYVTALYLAFLNRDADEVANEKWPLVLASGPSSRQWVTTTISRSDEHRANLVISLYKSLLGRGPEKSAMQF